MAPTCVNKGGSPSIVRLDVVPALEEEITLSPHALVALSRWQPKVGETISLLDSEGCVCRAKITELTESNCRCVPFERFANSAESSLQIELYQTLSNGDGFERVLQKATELGVTLMAPILSELSAMLEEHDALPQQSQRWSEVILSAAKQCRRSKLPEMLAPLSFDDVLDTAANAELKLLLYQGDSSWTFSEAFASLRPMGVAILVGPEEGFSEDEVERARNLGFLPVSLGPRILSTETAAITAISIVQGQLGDLR
ncbi:MAG: 16S rRNA (uracil(1498)-N(3))-methyltransferase [Desulfuromonadales bacterium]|nr:16S rRNA (uracil(1498)-N(3))-methyltransferase [Desulfuromonadales bacterium]